MAEISAGKDTTTGHWEMMGLVVEHPFRTYPKGFPRDVIAEYEHRIGRKTLGNKAASGTVILDELGEEHMRYEWLSPDAALERFVWPRERQALRDVMQLLREGHAGPVEDVLRVF